MWKMLGSARDADLIGKALNGSQRAWLVLVRRYEKRIYNLAYRMTGNPQDAMDLMQEAFLAVYRSLPNYRGDGAFPAWMLRIVAHRAMDFLRRRKHNPLDGAEPVTEDFALDEEAVGLAESQQLRLSLLRLLARLSNEQRLVVELKFFQFQTFEEMSRQLGVSENTLKTRLYSALQKLREDQDFRQAL